MKIDNQDIARTARQLRDEENEQIHVSPWNRHRRFHLSTWFVTIPAAAIVGFLLGIWTSKSISSEMPMTALVDTVYVTVEKSQTTTCDTAQSVTTLKPQRANVSVSTRKSAQPHRTISSGKSMMNDRIRYDLLVKN